MCPFIVRWTMCYVCTLQAGNDVDLRAIMYHGSMSIMQTAGTSCAHSVRVMNQHLNQQSAMNMIQPTMQVGQRL